VVQQCGSDSRERCKRREAEGYVVLQNTEIDDVTGQACYANNHWFVLPSIPCTGVESPDPACTGPAAERFWAFSYAEALQLGFPANGSSSDGSRQAPAWATLLNPAQRRSQHQAHFRIAHFEHSFDLVQRLQAAGNFSTNVRCGIAGACMHGMAWQAPRASATLLPPPLQAYPQTTLPVCLAICCHHLLQLSHTVDL
jgi:hypothetical protein